ncbi:hypothetical protein BC830DRAFT_1151443 [Chytriomyces sp. MP71]|nr:hypothetical protein BC830DRAFT_1151443 [Chytriomyces sp. MP71]
MNILKDQAEVERLAEEILSERQLGVDLDRRRNENREALGCFRRGQVDKRVWFFTDGLVMKMGRDAAKGFIEADQSELDQKIHATRDSVRDKMQELERLERELYPDKVPSTGAVTPSSFRLKAANLSDLLNSGE